MSDYEPNKMIPGTVYQVVRLLGQGGMGTVYEVEDTTVGKRYVLKTLHAELRTRKEIAARINKEARILARLSHPNIVEVVTAGVTGDALRLPYFLMQKLNGHTLRSVLAAKGRLPLETAYSIAIDLLDALDHAHSFGVIHRDVKPENIFLHRGPNDTHQTKLLDFGVMRMLSNDQGQTGARFVGTLRYAPPEQLRGEDITVQTDLYAAGLVLYEMLSGGGPFDDQTSDRGIANAHIETPPPPLASRIEIPAALGALVKSALAKDPADRPRDAFTFAARLRELSGIPMNQHLVEPSIVIDPSATLEAPRSATTTMGATSSHPRGRRGSRRSGAVVVGAIAVSAVVAGGIALGSQWRRGRGEGAIAPSERVESATLSALASAPPASATASTSGDASALTAPRPHAAPAPRHAPSSPPDDPSKPRPPGAGL